MAKRKSSNPRYAGERIINLVSPAAGVRVRFVQWYNPFAGRKTEVACALQVQISDEWIDLCRYDSDHGVFHRHKANWPAPGERDLTFPQIPMGERGARALSDVKENLQTWLKLIPKEVIDNDAAG